MSQLRIGVLSLQGDFREHIGSVESIGHEAFALNKAEQLAGIDGLILPGGESTTIAKLAKSFGLFDPIKKFIGGGKPVGRFSHPGRLASGGAGTRPGGGPR